MALPIYTLSLILDYARDLLGNFAAWIAGDDWPLHDSRNAAGESGIYRVSTRPGHRRARQRCFAAAGAAPFDGR